MKFFLFFLLAPSFLTFSQVDSIVSNDVNQFFCTASSFYTSPLRFDNEDWIKFSSVIGITALSSMVDKDIQELSQRNKNNFTKNLFNIDKYYYIEFVGGSVVALYGYGLLDNNSQIRKLAVKLTEATILASSITLITKIMVGRGRPYKQDSQYYTNPFSFDNDYNSLPSGHATLTFAYSTVMANEVDNIFWKVGWYSLAGLVSCARIYHNQHWFSDVFLGSAIGYFTGEFVSNYNSGQSEEVGLNLFPIPNGLAFQLRF